MLIVRTTLQTLNGKLGVYAAQEILESQKIIKIESSIDRWFYDQQVRADTSIFDFFVRYATYSEDKAAWHLLGDNARFITQSRDPNVIQKGINFYASRKIKIGEELTVDYFKLCDWVKRFGVKPKFNGQKIL